mmetsp:Transcript_837/g.1828  ORF Transcript_837/g.1828 Transcript_837/m.1828 type:complete len:336 (-) Transcript_837:6-1013(-)
MQALLAPLKRPADDDTVNTTTDPPEICKLGARESQETGLLSAICRFGGAGENHSDVAAYSNSRSAVLNVVTGSNHTTVNTEKKSISILSEIPTKRSTVLQPNEPFYLREDAFVSEAQRWPHIVWPFGLKWTWNSSASIPPNEPSSRARIVPRSLPGYLTLSPPLILECQSDISQTATSSAGTSFDFYEEAGDAIVDDELTFRSAERGVDNCVQEWSISVVYSRCFRVPVVYFTASYLADGQPVPWEALRGLLPESVNGAFSPAISQELHPVTGEPNFFLHPCHTAERIPRSTSNYLLSWFSMISPVFGLILPPDFFLRCSAVAVCLGGGGAVSWE